MYHNLLQVPSEGSGMTIVIIISLIIIFILARELNCWYWKINERNNLIRETNSLLRTLIDQNKFEFESKDPPVTGGITDVNDPKVDITPYSLPLISEDSLPVFQSKVYQFSAGMI